MRRRTMGPRGELVAELVARPAAAAAAQDPSRGRRGAVISGCFDCRRVRGIQCLLAVPFHEHEKYTG